MEVKEINERSWWVVKTPTDAHKVVAYKQKDKFRLECKCFKFTTVGICQHIIAVAKKYPEKPWAKPKRQEVGIPEYLGGDMRGQINKMLKRLTY